jgi:hypothetical protein
LRKAYCGLLLVSVRLRIILSRLRMLDRLRSGLSLLNRNSLRIAGISGRNCDFLWLRRRLNSRSGWCWLGWCWIVRNFYFYLGVVAHGETPLMICCRLSDCLSLAVRLNKLKMAGEEGIEPPTWSFGGSRSTTELFALSWPDFALYQTVPVRSE